MGSQNKALKLLGISTGSWHNRIYGDNRKTTDPIPQKHRVQPQALTPEEVERIEKEIRAGWERNLSTQQVCIECTDSGEHLGSLRTFERIAARMRARDRISAKPRAKRGARAVPVVVADRPDAAWSWDITDLPSPWVGVHFKAYAVTDIYSRKIVAHRVELKQCKDLAAQMFQQAFAQAIPGVVHADNGAAMIAGTTKKTLKAYGVTPSYSRPRVSNDNPFFLRRCSPRSRRMSGIPVCFTVLRGPGSGLTGG